jgi:hypothetical protein
MFMKVQVRIMKINDIIEELSFVLKGKTVDALLPPLLFMVLQSFFTLLQASIIALLISAGLAIARMIQKKPLSYALGGFLAVVVSAGFALFANNASDYFLPGILTSTALAILIVLSTLFDRPVAAYVSHLTRGWPLEWFWRDDIKPAYREVTVFWALMFSLNTTALWLLYLNASFTDLALVTTLLGLPFIFIVLIVTYVYGMWRLKQLQGPSVDEFLNHKKAPFRGQRKGF